MNPIRLFPWAGRLAQVTTLTLAIVAIVILGACLGEGAGIVSDISGATIAGCNLADPAEQQSRVAISKKLLAAAQVTELTAGELRLKYDKLFTARLVDWVGSERGC